MRHSNGFAQSAEQQPNAEVTEVEQRGAENSKMKF